MGSGIYAIHSKWPTGDYLRELTLEKDMPSESALAKLWFILYTCANQTK